MCNKCLRYGHHKDQCRGVVRCLFCSDQHESESCPLKDDLQNHKCIHCDGNHTAKFKDCPEKIRQRDINEIMAQHNISYYDANILLPHPKKKKDQAKVMYSDDSVFQFSSNEFPQLNKNFSMDKFVPNNQNLPRTFSQSVSHSQPERRIESECSATEPGSSSNSYRTSSQPNYRPSSQSNYHTSQSNYRSSSQSNFSSASQPKFTTPSQPKQRPQKRVTSTPNTPPSKNKIREFTFPSSCRTQFSSMINHNIPSVKESRKDQVSDPQIPISFTSNSQLSKLTSALQMVSQDQFNLNHLKYLRELLTEVISGGEQEEGSLSDHTLTDTDIT